MEDGEGTLRRFQKHHAITHHQRGFRDLISQMCEDPASMPDATGLKEALMPELRKHFPGGISGPRDGDPLPAAGRNVAWRDCPSAPLTGWWRDE